MPSERVLVKSMHRVANSTRGGEAGPGSKREAGCEDFQRCYGKWWEVMDNAESSKLPPTGGQAAAQALCAYLSLGI
jgi:hypothetical protein